ncbi:MAG: glutamate--tRNA ligase [Proteobacteria bacterium]|nr:glutamate--tRNA ligase [Pseudomonadota bacterium]
MTTVKTRFAPSPTGMLHIGGARTALFNYLYARHTGGEYLVRIEDTDAERNTPEAVDAIRQGLTWLGLMPDSDWVFQSKRLDAHKAAVEKLLAAGHAYKCFCTTEELDALRAEAESKGQAFKYPHIWRDRTDHPAGKPFVVRIKLPLDGTTSWDDAVQGRIDYPNTELDDFIIARSDGTPVYNLAVVVDDIDMGVTHVLRGDDHINNTPKQIAIYKALGAAIPTFGHVPLIHGPDGKKLSKRHGSVSTLAYRDMGYLPEALLNYLMRLGWSHGDQEIMSIDEAVAAFDMTHINKGPANFDFAKLDWLNAHYMKAAAPERLVELMTPFLKAPLTPAKRDLVIKGMPGLVQRAKRLTELAEAAHIYLDEPPFAFTEQAATALADGGKERIKEHVIPALNRLNDWSHDALDGAIKQVVTDGGFKFPQIGMPLRAALTGTTQAPAVTELLEVLGKDESLRRLSSL